jgi:PadR family transcriptional regulator, regulatory protein AphA
MTRSSNTPFVILGILGITGKPLSGYDIKQIVDGTITHFWSESYGQIYPVLKRLAADKQITAHAAGTSGRRRVVYTIAARGRKSLGEWLEKPPEPAPQRDALTLKLFFGSETAVSVSIRHLKNHRDRLKAMGAQYAAWLKTATGGHERYTLYQRLTLMEGIAMCAALSTWAEASIQTLRKLEKSR